MMPACKRVGGWTIISWITIDVAVPRIETVEACIGTAITPVREIQCRPGMPDTLPVIIRTKGQQLATKGRQKQRHIPRPWRRVAPVLDWSPSCDSFFAHRFDDLPLISDHLSIACGFLSSHPRGVHAATMAAFAPARPCVSAVRQYADESGRRYCKNKLRDHAFSKLNRRDLKSRTRLWAQSQEIDAPGQIKTAELVKYRRC